MSWSDNLLFYLSPAAWFSKKVMSKALDHAVPSPLNQDFGEASEDDISPPDSSYSTILAPRELGIPLSELSAKIDAITEPDITRIVIRARELRPQRTARFSYQVQGEEVTELLIHIDKIRANEIAVTVQSSLAVIGIVEFCFRER